MKPNNFSIRLFFLFAFLIGIIPIRYVNAQTSLNEVRVKVLWGNKPVEDMNIFLLNNDLSSQDEDTIENKTGAEIRRELFYDTYKYSTQNYLDLENLSDQSERGRKVKVLISGLIETINLYNIGEKMPHFNGEAYVHVESGERFYLIVLKDKGIYLEGEPFVFWLEEIYFPEGVHEQPKEIMLNQSNAIIWK